MNGNDIIKMVYDKLDSDASFKAKFIADPRGQIKALTGSDLPANVQVEVFESKENDLHFLLT